VNVHFTLYHLQLENDKQDADVSLPGKISTDAHGSSRDLA